MHLRKLFSSPKHQNSYNHIRVEFADQGQPVDLSTWSDYTITEWQNKVQELWYSSPGSAVMFEVVTYEHCSCFKRQTTMEVYCLRRSRESPDGGVRSRMSTAYADKMVGKEFPIQIRARILTVRFVPVV